MSLLFDIDELDPEYEIQQRQEAAVITLRPYQREAVDAVFSEWDAGHIATLVCLPTGTGKSVVFSDVMRNWMEKN